MALQMQRDIWLAERKNPGEAGTHREAGGGPSVRWIGRAAHNKTSAPQRW